jgi:hypothetical protein
MRNSCQRAVASGLALAILNILNAPASAQLRGHWRLQETSGTTAVDSSPLANNGTYTNGPTLASSTVVPSDGAISATFDGSNDYVAIPNEANFDLTGAMVVACWINVEDFDLSNQAIVCKGNSAWRLAREGTTNFVQFHCTGLTTTKVVSTASVNDGQWHHVAGVYTGSQLQIYIDGVLNNSVASSGSISTNNYAVEIGRNGEAAGREFDGSIYNVLVYNGLLPAGFVQQIYAYTGLIGHWKLNETSGTTATDATLIVNNGTFTNGVLLAATGPYPGAGDKSADFDGSNDYVATTNEYYYDLAGPMSVAAWIKVDTFTDQWQAIVTKGDTAWRLTRDNNNSTVRFSCSGLSTSGVASTIAINDGAWHHVVGVYTGSQLRMYIDGVLNNSVNSTGVISRNAYNFEIARNAEVAGREFDGKMHDVRIYSVALSASQVASLYGSIGHWKLNQSSGTTATDFSPHAKHGTVSGTASWTSDCGGEAAFDFNGSSNYISTTSAAHLQPTSALTIAAWVKGDSWGTAGNVDVVLRKGETDPTNYQLAVADGKVALFLDELDSVGVRGNTTLSTGQWHHVAAVWDGATVKIFVNGVLDNTPAARTGTIGTDTRPLYIGGRAGTDLFDGMIRDVRVYNRALYDAEIKYLAGLIGHWLFAEGAGTSAADSSGLTNHATLLAGASWTSDCAGNNALLTNGAGGIAQTANALRPPDVGTVAFWMRSTGAPAGTARILGVGPDWEVRQIIDGRVISDLCGDGGTIIGTTTPVTEVGRWYHFAATFDASDDTYAIYLDGQLELSGTNPVAMTQKPSAILSFGTRTGSTEYWSGALRDVRIYSRRLCPSEIAELFGELGHWKMDETSGAVAADSSIHGRDATVIGTATWTPGADGNCLQLNGSTRAEVASLLNAPKNVSLACWARLSLADSGGAELVSLGDYLAIRLDEGSISRAFFFDGSTWVSLSISQTFVDTGWHHFAAVFNDVQNTFKFYVDGTEVASMNTTVTIPYTGLGTKLVIGAHGNGQTMRDLTGRIDDVHVYSRALCPAEVQTLFDGGNPYQGVKIIKWVEIQ